MFLLIYHLQHRYGVPERLMALNASLNPATPTLPSIYRQERGDLYLDKMQNAVQKKETKV